MKFLVRLTNHTKSFFFKYINQSFLNCVEFRQIFCFFVEITFTWKKKANYWKFSILKVWDNFLNFVMVYVLLILIYISKDTIKTAIIKHVNFFFLLCCGLFMGTTVKPLITNTSKEFIKCRILYFLIMECCRYLIFLIKWLYETL